MEDYQIISYNRVNVKMKYAGAAIAGKNHRLNEKKCEDIFIGNQYGDICYIALADGAGGMKMGYQTANLAIEAVDNFARDFSARERPFAEITELPLALNDCLLNSGLSIEYMGTTFLCVFVKGDQYFIGHIGDGAILADFGNGFKVVSYPENGEFINETYFLPDTSGMSHFRMNFGKVKDSGCIILASDGIAYTLYDSVTQIVSPACNKLREWCVQYPQEECEQVLAFNLKNVFDSFSDDDKSLSILVF